MKKLEKVKLVESLAYDLKSAKSISFVDFAKMNVKTQTSLKNELKKVKARLLIVKNTLLKRAGKVASLPEESLSDSLLSGQTAIILGTDDPVAPIQVLGKFLKTSDIPQPKSAVVEGSFQTKEEVMAISALPGKLELLGQVISSIQSPIYALTATLEANLQKLVWVLQAKASA
jgi:large subunit ribosomal protein L10